MNGVPARRERLEEHFRVRGFIMENVEWVSSIGPTHSFVKWMKRMYLPKMPVELISLYLNYYSIIEKGSNGSDEYFMVCEDDVVFCSNWAERLSGVKAEHINILGVGVNFGLNISDGLTFTGNSGGSECTVYSKTAAQIINGNVDFNHGNDIMIGNIMNHFFKLDVCCTPICHQTSLIEDNGKHGSMDGHDSREWQTKEYTPTQLTWECIVNEYNQFMARKTLVESHFKEIYDTDVDIWNMEFLHVRYTQLTNGCPS